MEVPRYEAEGRIAEVIGAAAVVFVVGLLLWPPRYAYWTSVEGAIGETATLAVVGALATGAGAWFERTTEIALPHLVVGGLLAYLASMAGIAVLLSPDSPSHLALYGGLLGAFVGGATAWWVLERFVRERP